MKRTARYYRNGTTKKGAKKPANAARARAVKKKKDTEVNKRPSQVKKRVKANKARRKAKASGKNVKGKDYDHKVGRFVKSSTNRGRRGEGARKRKTK